MNYYNYPHKSNRLTMRPLHDGDAAYWDSFMHSKEATTLLPPYYKPPHYTAINWIKKQLHRYANNTFGLLALIDVKTGRLIGQAGLLQQQLKAKTMVEVGYHILPEYWVKGYAKEAAKYFLSYAFTQLELPHVIALIHPNNIASKGVATSIGMIPIKNVVHFGKPAIQFQITRQEFESIRKL